MPKKPAAKKKKPAPKKPAKKKTKAGKKPKPAAKKKPVKKVIKTGKKPKPPAKKKPVVKNRIPLKFPFGNQLFAGYLTPLEKLTPWGIPETYQIHLNNMGDQGEGTITIATGVWTIPGPVNMPQQLIDEISKIIEDF